MVFANPTYLYLLLLLIPLIGWYIYKLRKTQASLQVSASDPFDLPQAKSWKVYLRHVPFIYFNELYPVNLCKKSDSSKSA